MKSKQFLILIGVTAAILFCTQLARRSALAAAPTIVELKVTHRHPPNDHNVDWKIKDKKNSNGAFLVFADANQIVQWENTDEPMSIIVNNSNDWATVQGTFKPPTWGPGCTNCGQVDTTTGTPIQLTFLGKSKTNHYQIVVSDLGKVRMPSYDYDMVDATIVWSGTLEDKRKGQ